MKKKKAVQQLRVYFDSMTGYRWFDIPLWKGTETDYYGIPFFSVEDYATWFIYGELAFPEEITIRSIKKVSKGKAKKARRQIYRRRKG